MSDFRSLEREADRIVRQGGADTHAMAEVVKQLCAECEKLEKRVEEAERDAKKAMREARLY